jgi:hypothetical protein
MFFGNGRKKFISIGHFLEFLNSQQSGIKCFVYLRAIDYFISRYVVHRSLFAVKFIPIALV